MASDHDAVFRSAREAVRDGDFGKARQLYDSLRKSHDGERDKEVQEHYAYACERTGDYSEALDTYRKLMRQYLDDGVGDPDMGPQAVDGEGVGVDRVQDFSHDADEPGLISSMFRHARRRTVQAGELLCRAGEVANQMWLLIGGNLDVMVPGQGVMRVTGTSKRPCLLGELPYFTQMRRAADLYADTDVTLLELPYAQIPQIVHDEPDLALLLEHLFRHRLVLPVLSKHQIFKLLNEVDRRRIAFLFENVSLRPGEVLAEKGQEVPEAYMVRSGTMLLLYRDGEGVEKLIGSMQAGDMFHLGGLLRGFMAPYRIVSGTPVQLLRLPRERLEPFMLDRPWLIKALVKRSRMAGEKQILHPEAGDLWAADRYVDLDRTLG